STCFMIFFTVIFCTFVFNNFYFFFSSRRRHTRFSRDWSSDVCSSDLLIEKALERFSGSSYSGIYKHNGTFCPEPRLTFSIHEFRSEERRVGKECRSRWSPDD